MNMEPININNDDTQYEALKACQDKYVKHSDTHKDVSEIIKETNNSGKNGRG